MTPRDHDLRSVQPRSKFVALRWLVAGFVACTSLSAHALYANATPPAGFGGSPAGWTFAPPPSSAEKWLARTAMTTTTLNVGGRTTTMNALLRLSMFAPRAAAASMFTPAGMAAAAGAAILAPILADMLADHQMSWDQPSGQWKKTSTISAWKYSSDSPSYSSATSACIAFMAWYNSNPERLYVAAYVGTEPDGDGQMKCRATLTHKTSGDVSGPQAHGTVYESGPGETVTNPVSQPEFEAAILPYITPEMVPDLVPPGTPLPVELPIINPGPGDFPEPQVRRVPLGAPVPHPAPGTSNPIEFRQPVVDIVGRPTQAEPWRVDVTPKDIVTNAPEGQPAPDPITEPVNLPDPNTNPGSDPAQSEPKDPGLCEQYPDILACQKPDLDTPTDVVPKTERQISFTPESLFGGGTCPANPGWSDALGNHELNLVPVCDILASVVRPLVLAMAALAALFIVAPFRTDT